MEIIRLANAVDNNEPWNLFKNKNFKRLNSVLYVLINSIYKITILLQPFLPNFSKEIFNLLKQKEEIFFQKLKKILKKE